MADYPNETDCITLIGMASAGKSTLGKMLAHELGWVFIDTDHLIEGQYGTNLQAVTDSMTKEEFLDVECAVVSAVRAKRCVIATGGSVVYREAAMEHLRTLGPVCHLNVELPTIVKRISAKPDRGLAIAPGETIEDLYNERAALYRKFADVSIECDNKTPGECVTALLAALGA
ncbi:homoserine kinase [Halodesulfovibrio spirochaetisodalis]|uniref:Shikimate kinase n=1 Tax=Halodesulfovibrio spirochaetisodalis TaxID=1560234 RepID=A0A1B7XEX4_9BACT|nr:homoserine kinase [Halodesulfovibrio spirochaetisodalis]OBQ52746.1 shikimate kinase [Halodesulfovibrio spirochaetisodalis]